VWLNS